VSGRLGRKGVQVRIDFAITQEGAQVPFPISVSVNVPLSWALDLGRRLCRAVWRWEMAMQRERETERKE